MKKLGRGCFALFMSTLRRRADFSLKKKSECIAKGYITLFLLFRFLNCLFWSLRHDINLKIAIVPVLYLKFTKSYSACPNTQINLKIGANSKSALKSAHKIGPIANPWMTVQIIQKNVKNAGSFFLEQFNVLHVTPPRP
jgi:hypothetical protein